MTPFAGKQASEKLIAFLASIERTTSVRDLTALLALDAGRSIDQAGAA
jgi:hypothetical protein